MTAKTERPGERELILSMTLDAPREKVWRCWTEPDLYWFSVKWTLGGLAIVHKNRN